MNTYKFLPKKDRYKIKSEYVRKFFYYSKGLIDRETLNNFWKMFFQRYKVNVFEKKQGIDYQGLENLESFC